MNSGQVKFLRFIVERVDENEKDAVKAYLEENFKKQDAGSFGIAEVEATKAFLKDKIKAEYQEEVQQIMIGYASNLKK